MSRSNGARRRLRSSIAEAFFWQKIWLGMLLGSVEISLLIDSSPPSEAIRSEAIALSSKGIVAGSAPPRGFTVVDFLRSHVPRLHPVHARDGIGFWPPPWFSRLGFGAVHLGNPGEGPVGAASVALVGIFFAFNLRRTGNLWYAVGLHASFDWGETYTLLRPQQRHLHGRPPLQSILHGAKWLTGALSAPKAVSSASSPWASNSS